MAIFGTRMSWDSFLDHLAKGIDKLEERIERASTGADGSSYPVLYYPIAKVAGRHEILVGVGSWRTKEGDLVRHSGVCLYNKATPFAQGQRFDTVTDFVLRAPPEVWREWKAMVGSDTSPSDVLGRFSLLVEDVSPDSCLGLIAFLALTAAVTPKSIPEEWPEVWIEYARRWEKGDVRTTGKPFESWGALHNALAHGCFGPKESQATQSAAAGGNETDSPAAQSLSVAPQASDAHRCVSLAWVECLRFVLGGLRRGAAPDHLTAQRPWPQLIKAQAFLRFEYQRYLESLRSGQVVQLLVPLRGTSTRLRLIDAFFTEQHVPLGSDKVFLRNDQEHTWFEDGFTLMGVFKPWERGTGNDITFSLDPTSGCHLEDLWWELERMEDEKWEGKRPCSNSRPGILGYPNGRRPNGEKAPDEPWYDEQGAYGLLAAPRQVPSQADGSSPGSKLTWREAVDAAWRCYNPLRYMRINVGSKVYHLSESCPPLDTAVSGSKRAIIADWQDNGYPDRPFAFTPTVQRYFAACISRDPEDESPITIGDLPEEGSFDFFELEGGIAIVNNSGVFLLNDWRSEPLKVDDLKMEFKNVADRFETLESVGKEVLELVSLVEDRIVRGGRKRRLSKRSLLDRITELKLRVQLRFARTGPGSTNPQTLRFRQILEQRWGMAQRLTELVNSIEQVETSLRAFIDMRTNRMVTFLTLYGFPAALLAGFFQFVLQDFPEAMTLAGRKLVFVWGGVHWLGFVTYAIVTTLAILILRRLVRPRRQKPD